MGAPPDPPLGLCYMAARRQAACGLPRVCAPLRYDVAPQRCVDILGLRCKDRELFLYTQILYVHLTKFTKALRIYKEVHTHAQRQSKGKIYSYCSRDGHGSDSDKFLSS